MIDFTRLIQLPHTAGCLVCGRDNPHGLQLDLHVDRSTGVVYTTFTPGPEHIGFEGIIHGGVLATVLDEVMVWAATWSGRRFCVCGELNVRFRRSAQVGVPIQVEAAVDLSRGRLITTVGTLVDSAGVIAEGSAKYVPLSHERNREFLETLQQNPSTLEAVMYLREEATIIS